MNWLAEAAIYAVIVVGPGACLYLAWWFGCQSTKRRYISELRWFEQAARRWLFLRRYLRVGEKGAMKHLVFVNHDELAYVTETPAAAPVSALVDLAIDREQMRVRAMRTEREEGQAK